MMTLNFEGPTQGCFAYLAIYDVGSRRFDMYIRGDFSLRRRQFASSF